MASNNLGQIRVGAGGGQALNGKSASAWPSQESQESIPLENPASFGHVCIVAVVNVELESDAVEKLKSAMITPLESLSDVVRRAEFPPKPWLARDLLEDLKQRAGSSPLTDEALDRLSQTQSEPSRSPSHWDGR